MTAGAARRLLAFIAAACCLSLFLAPAAAQPLTTPPEAAGSGVSDAAVTLFGTTTASAHERALVAALLARFEAAYQPSADVLDAAWHVAALGRQLELEALPRLTFTERTTWDAYERLALDLDLSAFLTLYRSNGALLERLQGARVRMLGLEEALAWNDASHRFRSDLLALSSFRFIKEQLAAALARVNQAYGDGPADISQALRLYPEERDFLALKRALEELRVQVAHRIADLEAALQAALRTDDALPALPPPEALMPLLVSGDFHVARCLATSPILMQADLHNAVQGLESASQNALDFRVELHGSALYRSGDLLATVGLELRLPLPSGAPLSGQVSLSADPVRAEQTLRLSWPPNEPQHRPTPETEHADRNAAERAALEAEIVHLFRSVEAARASAEGAELQLLWLITDIYPAETRSGEASEAEVLVTARGLSRVPAPDLYADLQRVRYLTEFAFARQAHGEQLLALEVVCGPGT